MNRALLRLRMDVTRRGGANTGARRSQLPFSPKTRITLADRTIQTVKARAPVLAGLILAVGAKLAPAGGEEQRHRRHTCTAKDTTGNKRRHFQDSHPESHTDL